MSPSSKSKSKDKRAAGKEPQRSSAKPTSTGSTGGGAPANGYNPLLGTFHSLETAPLSPAPPSHLNTRSRIDDPDDHSGNVGIEYDSLSNNGSWSGESEDHKEKDKTVQGPSRQEGITIPGVDSDKREKIRQKNEKKHQRQKERRAQELHERCSGYLMSRKLESLSEQLVAMGFSSERATMALILNEGRVEQSVAWLFEGGEDGDNERDRNLDGGGSSLKIDISEELAQIADMEIKFRCSKQEVERAVVVCEGNLEQAAETLKSQKQEPPPAVPPKPEDSGDLITVGGGKVLVAVGQNASTSRAQSKHAASPIQQKPDDRDFNYTKMAVSVGPPAAELGMKNLQLLKKIQPNSEWTKPQVGTPVDKKWAAGGSNPSVSYSLASPLQAAPPPPSKTESRYATIGNELKNLQLREPVIVMQRPKSKHVPTSGSSASSSASHAADWHPNVVESVTNMNNPNAFSHIPTSTRSFGTGNYVSSGGGGSNAQLYDQFHYQQQQQTLPQQYVSVSNGGPGPNPNPNPLDHHFSQPMNHFGNNGMWNRMVGGGGSSSTTTTTPTLAAASSLGLFSGLGSSGSSGPSSPVDWNACDSLQFDYTNIDWSLDRIPLPSTRPNGMWMGLGSSPNAADLYSSVRGGRTSMRPPVGLLPNGNNGLSISSMGLHPDGVGAASEASAGEWTSPFEEKDLFSFPRQFVSSPSL